MKRKKEFLGIACTFIVLLAGCSQSGTDEAYQQGYDDGYQAALEEMMGVLDENIALEEELQRTAEAEQPPQQDSLPIVTVEDLPYSIVLREPDSAGYVYADVTYTNNSEFPITYFSMTALLKDSNEKTYYSSSDTVMPGETSAIFNGFGPKSTKMEDIEILKIEITALVDDEEVRIDYDTKLKKYK